MVSEKDFLHGSAGRTFFTRRAVALIFIFCLGVVIRLLPYANFITPDGVYFLEGDNYEHLRKILVILADFPKTPVHDYYAGFPAGSGAIWAPLFDISIAILVKISGFLGAGFEKTCALIPPFAGMLVVVPVYLWAKRLFGARAAVFSAFIIALLPSHVSMTTVGRLDNELIEPLLAGFVFLAYSFTAARARGRLAERDICPALVAGLVMAAALLYWRGAIIWWGLIALHAFFATLVDDRRWASSVIIFASAALVIAVVTLLGLWGTQSTTSFNTVGWFHVISALLAVAAIGAIGLAGFLKKSKGVGVSCALALAAFAAFVVLIALIAPSFFTGILSGLGVIGGKNPWTSTIAEYQPLFIGKNGGFDPLSTIGISTVLVFVFPVALAYLTIKFFKEGGVESFFILAGWATFVLTVINGRYENVLAVLLSIVGGFVAASIPEKFVKAGLASVVAGFLISLVFLLPSYAFYRDLKHTEPFGIRGDMEESLLWLRDNTPQTSHFLEPHKKPEYGVMARWEYGGWIEYVAKRPSIATLFGIETHGLMESAEFFLETDVSKALSMLDSNGARYVVITKDFGALSGYAALLEKDPADYVLEKRGPEGSVRYETGQKFLDLVFTRLLLADGEPVGAPAYMAAVPGLRLVHESGTTENIPGALREVKKIKIFERVPGVVVTGGPGSARPGEVVVLRGEVVTNQSRRFQAVNLARAREDGSFEVNARYPAFSPGVPSGITGVEGFYTLSVSGREKTVTITEDDVLSGGVMDVKAL